MEIVSNEEMKRMIKEYLEKIYICKVQVDYGVEFRTFNIKVNFNSISLIIDLIFTYDYNVDFVINMTNLCKEIYNSIMKEVQR